MNPDEHKTSLIAPNKKAKYQKEFSFNQNMKVPQNNLAEGRHKPSADAVSVGNRYPSSDSEPIPQPQKQEKQKSVKSYSDSRSETDFDMQKSMIRNAGSPNIFGLNKQRTMPAEPFNAKIPSDQFAYDTKDLEFIRIQTGMFMEIKDS